MEYIKILNFIYVLKNKNSENYMDLKYKTIMQIKTFEHIWKFASAHVIKLRYKTASLKW